MELTTILSYGYFLLCLVLGWIAAGVLDYESLLKQSSSRWRQILLRLGIALVLAEGFRLFLSFILGPLLDELVSRSAHSFNFF